jgi:7,8-dihydroneopterin 2',3'-cyclic phosphate phosphodiesterase
MEMELRNLVDKIEDRALRKKVVEFIEDPSIKIGGKLYRGLSMETSPASKSSHHSYPKGLLQHTISTSKLALKMCDIVEETYKTEVERDTVLASTILHDVMKPLTYIRRGDGTYGSSSLGERVDHLTLAVSELVRRGFPLEVVHAVASHHGRSGPISPHTIEALLCSLADLTDATLNSETLRAAEFLVRDCVGEDFEHLSAEEAFAIVDAKKTGGCEEVKRIFEKMRAG